MALDTELSLSVVIKHEFSFRRMHTVTGKTCHWLTIAGILDIFPERMGNLVLPLMAARTGLNLVLLQVEGPVGMRRHMTFKAFSVFHRNAFD